MDGESDDSERWEDFFGSSTDLTPSLLGIYDSLTSNFHPQGDELRKCMARGDNNQPKPPSLDERATCASSDSYLSKLQAYAKRAGRLKTTQTDFEDVNRSSGNNSAKGSIESVSSCGAAPSKLRTNIPQLSANVQRLIIHSEAEPVDTVGLEMLQTLLNDSSDSLSPSPHKRATTSSQKKKCSNIPLSRTTGKLAQTGSDLVPAMIATSDDVVTPGSLDLRKTSSISHSLAKACGEKTPTNCPTLDLDATLRAIRMLDLTTADAAKPKTENDANDLELQLGRCELSGHAVYAPSTRDKLDCDQDVNNGRISQHAAEVQFTRVRPKSPAPSEFMADESTLVAPSSFGLAIGEGRASSSADKFDNRQTDLKPKRSPKEVRKLSGLVLPDIAKLKHRPLSSSSICSTSSSSSSSSGADALNGKLNTPYLASVESLADHSENELMDGHVSMTVFERACMEIVDSERNYVNDLGEVISGYLMDWKERASLPVGELSVLFSNIEEVYEFNRSLLQRLSNAILNPVKIAKCFIELREGFDVYTTYCTSYPEAISLLTSLLQATHTNTLLASTQRMLHHTLPLGSYLLKPVQRILKYHLLLDNLRKHCDIKEVMQAYEIMRQVARNIDQVKRKLEQQTRVKELSGILDGWLGPELTVLGELRLEGVLMENNKPRKVLLFSTMLIIAKAKEDNRLQFKTYIHQNNLMLSEHLTGEPTSFYVIPYDEPRNQIKLTAKNRDQKRLWTQQIKSVLLEKFENIPQRAKELVFQLGDEEDRYVDRSLWKWGLHSTSTPTYLERRNQFRRSELRNRSKGKRKTISNSSSIELFHDTLSTDNDVSKSAESIHENLVSSFDDAATLSTGKVVEVRDTAKSVRSSTKSFRFGSKPLKERSKSVPRISAIEVETEGRKELTTQQPSPVGINTMTLPKRVTTSLKRQKSKAKETSTFYMTLSEFDDAGATVLKITESSESIVHNSQREGSSLSDVMRKTQQPADIEERTTSAPLAAREQVRQDAEIVLDLLKNSKEFDKFCSKLQKKRSLEKSVTHASTSAANRRRALSDLPPRPPSRSPPPLDTAVPSNEVTQASPEEPIYETLLRNVHVPYKFSPVLGRSKSVQYNQPVEQKTSTVRPESDYVTLVYTKNGFLSAVGQESMVSMAKDIHKLSRSPPSSSSSTVTLKRKSVESDKQENVEDPQFDKGGLMSVSFHGESDLDQARSLAPKSLLQRLWSHSSLAMEEARSTPLCRSTSHLERRGSYDGHSVLHLQGSETIGERMAHVDYADPRTLFAISKHEPLTQLQRDSVFSLTSSNDSVCEAQAAELHQICDKFNYEDSVEASLENDFRDSAVYSDDNDRRTDNTLTPTSPASRNPPLKPKPLHIPPSRLTLPPVRRSISHCESRPPLNRNPGVVMCPPNLSPVSSRSWVLQQINNFSK